MEFLAPGTVVVTVAKIGRCNPIVCTCILHLMSSMGVKRNDVKAPLAAPQKTSALSGNFSLLRSGYSVRLTNDCAKLYCVGC